MMKFFTNHKLFTILLFLFFGLCLSLSKAHDFQIMAAPGQLICMPIDDSGNITNNKYQYHRMIVKNQTSSNIQLKVQWNLCPFVEGSIIPGYTCNTYVNAVPVVVNAGQELIIPSSNTQEWLVNDWITFRTTGQLDIQVDRDHYNYNNIDDSNIPDCFNTVDNLAWQGGIAFTIKGNASPCEVPTNTPTPTLTPTATLVPTATLTPMPTDIPEPPAPQCNSITPYVNGVEGTQDKISTLKPGDMTNFVCAGNNNFNPSTDEYKFRVVYNGEERSLSTLDSEPNKSEIYEIPALEYGKHIAQCRVCRSGACQEWEQLPVVEKPVITEATGFACQELSIANNLKIFSFGDEANFSVKVFSQKPTFGTGYIKIGVVGQEPLISLEQNFNLNGGQTKTLNFKYTVANNNMTQQLLNKDNVKAWFVFKAQDSPALLGGTCTDFSATGKDNFPACACPEKQLDFKITQQEVPVIGPITEPVGFECQELSIANDVTNFSFGQEANFSVKVFSQKPTSGIGYIKIGVAGQEPLISLEQNFNLNSQQTKTLDFKYTVANDSNTQQLVGKDNVKAWFVFKAQDSPALLGGTCTDFSATGKGTFPACACPEKQLNFNITQ